MLSRAIPQGSASVEGQLLLLLLTERGDPNIIVSEFRPSPHWPVRPIVWPLLAPPKSLSFRRDRIWSFVHRGCHLLTSLYLFLRRTQEQMFLNDVCVPHVYYRCQSSVFVFYVHEPRMASVDQRAFVCHAPVDQQNGERAH